MVEHIYKECVSQGVDVCGSKWLVGTKRLETCWWEAAQPSGTERYAQHIAIIRRKK